MTYNEVRGSGLAAVCPVIEEGTTNLSEIKAGTYKLQQLCMEPTKIWVGAASCALCHPDNTVISCWAIFHGREELLHLNALVHLSSIPRILRSRHDLQAQKLCRTSNSTHTHTPTHTVMQVKEEGVMKDAKPDWAKGTLLTRQTTNLSDVGHL